MNREQIVRKLAEEMHISLVDSRNYVDTLLNIWIEGLEEDEKITIHGFGRLFILPQTPRVARNPKTGDIVMLKPRNTIRLKPSKTLIDRINRDK